MVISGSPNRVETSSRKKQFFPRYLILIILGLVGLWILAWLAARLLIVTVPLDRADAIVVLSGSETLNERAVLAADLFNEGVAPLVVLTNDNLRGGWSSAEQRNPFFYEGAKRELQRRGVPSSGIVLIPEPVDSTRSEAQAVRKFAEQHKLRSLLLVTSGYHSRRALGTFGKEFEGTGMMMGLAAVRPGAQTPSPALWWSKRRGWKMVAGEYFKLVYYSLPGS
jgi:uncharacterized SAM-binding protein YcdF (DUF218 family)